MACGARETLSWLEHDGSHGLCKALKSAPLLLPSLSFFPENQSCVRVRCEAGQETLGFSLENFASAVDYIRALQSSLAIARSSSNRANVAGKEL